MLKRSNTSNLLFFLGCLSFLASCSGRPLNVGNDAQGGRYLTQNVEDGADGADPGGQGIGSGSANGGTGDGNTAGSNGDKDGNDSNGGSASGKGSGDDTGKSGGGSATGDNDDGNGANSGGGSSNGTGDDDNGASNGGGSANGNSDDDDDGINGGGSAGTIDKGGIEIDDGEDSIKIYTAMTVTTNKFDKGGGTVRVRRLNGSDDDDWESVTLPKSGSVQIDGMCFNRDKATEVEVEFEYSKGTLRLGTKDMKVKNKGDRSVTIVTEYDGCFLDFACSGPDDTTFTLSCPKGDLDVE